MAEISIMRACAHTRVRVTQSAFTPSPDKKNQRVNLHMTLHPAFTLPSPGQRARGATTAYPNTKKNDDRTEA